MAIKSLFQQSSHSILRFLFAIAICLSLLILDVQSQSLEKIRSAANVAILPVRYMVHMPMSAVYWLTARATTTQQLVRENAKLRAHELLLESKLQKMLTLERENASLRSLFSSSSQLNGHAIMAQILAVDLDPSLEQVIVDKGRINKAYAGQPVLDAYGVMGQLVNVGYMTSRVLLVTDAHSAVPVEDGRNGIRSVAVGDSQSGLLALFGVPDSKDIQTGDTFVTSGLGLRYPVGYPVGKVIKVEHHPGKTFATIWLEPAAHIDRSRQVLLAWPQQAKLESRVKEQLKMKVT